MPAEQANRPTGRDTYRFAAERTVMPGGVRSSFDLALARETARLAVADASAHKKDEQWVRIAASAARDAARTIVRETGQTKVHSGLDNPSWRDVVHWPEDVQVTHAKTKRSTASSMAWYRRQAQVQNSREIGSRR